MQGELGAVGRRRADADRRVRKLGRRLVVAGLLFMPLCDASIGFSIVPSVRFPGWQWLLVALALPVVTWCAWPFYVAALRQARHGLTTMDTLASIGIVAATCWSVFAMFFLDASTARTRSPMCSSTIPGVRSTSTSRPASPPSCWPAATSKRGRRRRAADALSTLAAVGAKDVSILDARGSSACARWRPHGRRSILGPTG